MRFLFSLLIAITMPVFAFSQSQTTDIRPNAKRIKGDALLEEFLGVTHRGAYNFSEEGEPRRFYTETHNEDSSVHYSDENTTTKGVWSLMRNHLCFSYASPKMNGGCFRVYKVGNCFYYYDQSIPERALEIDENYWTARSVKKGETPNCEPNVS